jgi:hypothetical protein
MTWYSEECVSVAMSWKQLLENGDLYFESRLSIVSSFRLLLDNVPTIYSTINTITRADVLLIALRSLDQAFTRVLQLFSEITNDIIQYQVQTSYSSSDALSYNIQTQQLISAVINKKNINIETMNSVRSIKMDLCVRRADTMLDIKIAQRKIVLPSEFK